MAENEEMVEEEEIVIDEELEEPEPSEKVEASEDEPSSEDEESSDEMVVTIGDEAPEEHEKAPGWVRELRKAHREIQKENRELREKLKVTETKPVALEPKPKLEDYDYDTDRFEQSLSSWYEKKRKADESAEAQRKAEEKQQQEWQSRLSTYEESKAKLKVSDFEDVEALVLETLDQTQQGIIIQGAENSALLFLALGKNPNRLKEMAAIKDPVQFAVSVGKLEDKINMKPRKSAPAPEKTVSGTAPTSGVDSTLERLRKEAEKTGDYTKVSQYKRNKRQS